MISTGHRWATQWRMKYSHRTDSASRRRWRSTACYSEYVKTGMRAAADTGNQDLAKHMFEVSEHTDAPRFANCFALD